MAIGFIPYHTQIIDVKNLSKKAFLALLIETVKELRLELKNVSSIYFLLH